VAKSLAQDDYQPGPDSIAQPGVPKGELIKGTYTAKEGSVFPGTEREYTIYLPAGFDKANAAAHPAPFMIFQDGVIYNAPVVFDNLIAKGQIPPLIGIFIKPGVVPAANPNALPRYNRSYEYDSVTDTYSRFLIDEFLPALEAKHGIKLSTDPNDAAISGNSSGGICAFMTAWHRPDRFRRVFSGVGTYVGIHGADQLPVLVRKYEPKPLRIYLQSGEHDNDLYCGDWWMANQTMERALKWAGYDVNHTWGTGGHNSKHASQIFPDVLRWLWRDYATAKEIKPNPRVESKWLGYSVLGDGKWEECWRGKEFSDANSLASNSVGVTYASDLESGDVWVLRHGSKPQKFARHSPNGTNVPCISQIIAGAGDDLLATTIAEDGLLAISRDGKVRQAQYGNKLQGEKLCLSSDGWLYISTGWNRKIAYFPIADKKHENPIQIETPDETWVSALTLSPDQTHLYAASQYTRYVLSYQITKDHGLSQPERLTRLEANDSGIVDTRGLCVDTNGWLYVATALGIQVCDHAGRVNFIIPTPQQPHDVCFGGKDLGELFIACGDKIYKRPTKAHGIVSGQMAPIKPPPPKL
jgi:enterochelin esterase-like enzyme